MGNVRGKQFLHMKALGGREGVGRALHIPGRELVRLQHKDLKWDWWWKRAQMKLDKQAGLVKSSVIIQSTVESH